MKPSLTFYTNIVSPYQLDFFEELAKRFSLCVIFYSQSESDRSWSLSVDGGGYEVVFLRTGPLTRLIQKLMPSYHFSFDIFSASLSDKSDFVILGGNYYIPNTLVALLIASWKGKSIYWFGEKVFSAGPIKTIFKKALLQPIMLLTDGILAVGKDGIKSYQSYGYRKPCYNIPYNIDDKKFDKKFLDSAILKYWSEKLNSIQKRVVLTSGSLIARKGMDTAIKAFIALSEKNKDGAELWVLGDGELRSELELLAFGNTNIKFLGFLQPADIPYIFALSDIFIFCSRYDGWGVVINEALSAGLPVITSEQARSCELVINGEAGYVHHCEHITQFSNSMDLLLSDASLRKELSLRAIVTAKKWNSAVIAEKVSSVLEGRSLD